MNLSLIRQSFPTEESYREYIGTAKEDCCLEYEKPEKDDQWALETLRKCLGVTSGTELQNWTKKDRDDALRQYKAKGLTLRQIGRLTGIGRNIIQRA